MHAGARTGSIACSARTVGGGRARAFPPLSRRRTPPHTFPLRRIEPCTHYLSAESPSVVTPRRAIAACNVARYSES